MPFVVHVTNSDEFQHGLALPPVQTNFAASRNSRKPKQITTPLEKSKRNRKLPGQAVSYFLLDFGALLISVDTAMTDPMRDGTIVPVTAMRKGFAGKAPD